MSLEIPASIPATLIPGRAVQRCRLAVTESALQHLMDEVRRLIARGIPEPAIV